TAVQMINWISVKPEAERERTNIGSTSLRSAREQFRYLTGRAIRGVHPGLALGSIIPVLWVEATNVRRMETMEPRGPLQALRNWMRNGCAGPAPLAMERAAAMEKARRTIAPGHVK